MGATQGYPIVLTADRTLLSNYELLFDGMLAASQTTKAKGPVTVFDSPDGLANVVTSVDPGGTLTILDQQGDFYHVKTADGKEGFVARSAVDPGALDSGIIGGGTASEMSTAGASRGLTPEAVQYAGNHHIDPALAKHIEDVRKKITTAQWVQFAQDGNVGVIPARLQQKSN